MSSEPGLERYLLELVHPDGPRSASPPEPATEFLALLRAHRVAGLAAAALQKIGRLDPLRDRLQPLVLAELSARALLDDAAVRTQALLGEAKIDSIWLKGEALGRLIYTEPSLRPMSDLDLLIPAGQLDSALDCLARHEYSRPSAASEAFWSEAYYNLPLSIPGATPLALELHWSIAQSGRHTPDLAGLWQRRQPLPGGGFALGNEDLLLHQTLHHAYHYFESRLSWIYDLALLHRRPHDRRATLERAREWGMSVPLALSVRQVEKSFPGSVGQEYLQAAERCRRARWAPRLLPPYGPFDYLGAWKDRPRQLVLGLFMLDRPAQMGRQLRGYLWRTWRHGDRAGHKQAKPGQAKTADPHAQAEP